MILSYSLQVWHSRGGLSFAQGDMMFRYNQWDIMILSLCLKMGQIVVYTGTYVFFYKKKKHILLSIIIITTIIITMYYHYYYCSYHHYYSIYIYII